MNVMVITPEPNDIYIVIGGVITEKFKSNTKAYQSYKSYADMLIRSNIIPYWTRNVERFFSRSYLGIFYSNFFRDEYGDDYARGSSIRTHQIKKSLYYTDEGDHFVLRIKPTHAWSDGRDYFTMLRKGSKKHDFPGYDPSRDRRVDYRPGHEWQGYTNIQWIIWDNTFRSHVNSINNKIIQYTMTLPNVTRDDVLPHNTQIDKNYTAWMSKKTYFNQGRVIDLAFPTQKLYPGGRR